MAASSPSGSPATGHLLHPFDLAVVDPRIAGEIGAWQDLTERLGYTEEEAALVLARAHARGVAPVRIRERLEELTA